MSPYSGPRGPKWGPFCCIKIPCPPCTQPFWMKRYQQGTPGKIVKLHVLEEDRLFVNGGKATIPEAEERTLGTPGAHGEERDLEDPSLSFRTVPGAFLKTGNTLLWSPQTVPSTHSHLPAGPAIPPQRIQNGIAILFLKKILLI